VSPLAAPNRTATCDSADVWLVRKNTTSPPPEPTVTKYGRRPRGATTSENESVVVGGARKTVTNVLTVRV
jgi:hypothetical protein